MNIYILSTEEFKFSQSQKNLSLALLYPDKAWAEELDKGDLVYLDLSSVADDVLNSVLATFIERCTERGSKWGVLDSKGICQDPADLFFQGAVDYLGPYQKLRDLNASRVKKILTRIEKNKRIKIEEETEELSKKLLRQNKKAFAFSGWNKLQKGKDYDFFLLYFSMEDTAGLRRLLGDRAFSELIRGLKVQIMEWIGDGDPLLWMEDASSLVYLLPADSSRAEFLVKGLLAMLLNLNIISIEKLSLSFIIPLTLALHRAHLPFVPPGETGALVNEAVNFIFHLGTQRGRSGSLLCSEPVFITLPSASKDFFKKAKAFEGKPLWYSPSFININKKS